MARKLLYKDTPAVLAAAPPYIGRLYLDTTEKSLYISFGTATAADWYRVASFKPKELVLSAAQTAGFKLDFTTPTYAWEVLKGQIFLGAAGVTWETYKTGVKAIGLGSTATLTWECHLSHEDISDFDKYLRVHTRHNGTSITGDLVLSCVICHNYGYGRTGSPAPITKTITVPAASMPQHDTAITEILIAQNGGGVGLFDSTTWQPDDDINVSISITSFPTITGGLSSQIFMPFIDINRQVTGHGTKYRNKSGGSFYGS